MKRWWLYFQPTLLSEAFNVSREKIVSTLNGLHAAGDIILSVWGVRQGYKIIKKPPTPNSAPSSATKSSIASPKAKTSPSPLSAPPATSISLLLDSR
jgi:biotin operon repressor